MFGQVVHIVVIDGLMALFILHNMLHVTLKNAAIIFGRTLVFDWLSFSSFPVMGLTILPVVLGNSVNTLLFLSDFGPYGRK